MIEFRCPQYERDPRAPPSLGKECASCLHIRLDGECRAEDKEDYLLMRVIE